MGKAPAKWGSARLEARVSQISLFGSRAFRCIRRADDPERNKRRNGCQAEKAKDSYISIRSTTIPIVTYYFLTHAEKTGRQLWLIGLCARQIVLFPIWTLTGGFSAGHGICRVRVLPEQASVLVTNDVNHLFLQNVVGLRQGCRGLSIRWILRLALCSCRDMSCASCIVYLHQ